MRQLLVAIAVSLAAGCGPGSIKVSTDRESVAPGDCIGVIVENTGSLEGIEFDHCAPVLFTYNGEWFDHPRVVAPESCPPWTMEVGGFSRSMFFAAIPADREGSPGIYDFALDISWPGIFRRERVFSAAFTIEGDAQELDARCDFSKPVAPPAR